MLHDFESDFLQKILIKDCFQENIEYAIFGDLKMPTDRKKMFF